MAQGGGLLRCKLESCALLRPVDSRLDFDVWQCGSGLRDTYNGIGDAFLRAGGGRQLAGGAKVLVFLVVGLDRKQSFALDECLDALLDQRGFDRQQFDCVFEDHLHRTERVAFILQCAHGVQDARVDALFGIGRKAEIERDLVCSLEADALDVFGQSVGLVLQNALGAAAVLFDQSHALRGRDAIGLQEHHHVAHGMLLIPRGLDRLGALLADARDFV